MCVNGAGEGTRWQNPLAAWPAAALCCGAGVAAAPSRTPACPAAPVVLAAGIVANPLPVPPPLPVSPRSFDFLEIVELLNCVYCMGQLLEFVAFVWLRIRWGHGLHAPGCQAVPGRTAWLRGVPAAAVLATCRLSACNEGCLGSVLGWAGSGVCCWPGRRRLLPHACLHGVPTHPACYTHAPSSPLPPQVSHPAPPVPHPVAHLGLHCHAGPRLPAAGRAAHRAMGAGERARLACPSHLPTCMHCPPCLSLAHAAAGASCLPASHPALLPTCPAAVPR